LRSSAPTPCKSYSNASRSTPAGWRSTESGGDLSVGAGRRHLPRERVVTWLAMAGFMGTGKSRIGWELSRRLQLTYVDTDRVIERVGCMRITDIFELYGEGVFRDYESEIVRRCV